MSDVFPSSIALSDVESLDIDVYPNPASTFFTVNNIASLSEISLDTIFGQLIFKTQSNQTSETIDVSSIHKGVYILTIKSGTLMRSEKIIIQ